MDIHRLPSPSETACLDTEELRAAFTLQDLCQSGAINYQLTDLDRAIAGFACPVEPLRLEADPSMRSESFCERREAGILNVGEKGAVEVDGATHELDALEMLYVGRGAKDIAFHAAGGARPIFYLVSYPAHQAYPTVKATAKDARHVPLGSPEEANERVIHQYIHEDGVQSCQLVMGYTELKPGSVWNTMPPHTHDRRSEIYMYFDINDKHRVLHLIGEPQETRHLFLQSHDIALSPPWSIHSGCGTANYKFSWAMGGENQSFTDMDGVPVSDLR